MTFLQAIDWMRRLDEFKLHWIEEPTSADDVLGHRIISQVKQSVKTLRRGKINYWQGLRSSGVGVATGECCQNRVMFKQFLMSGGMQFCQVRREERPINVKVKSYHYSWLVLIITSLCSRWCTKYQGEVGVVVKF